MPARGLGLVAPVGGREAHAAEVALQVDADHGVEVFLGHVEDRRVAQEAGVVDEDVEIAQGVERGLDHRLRVVPIGDVAEVRHGLAALLADLLHHRARGRFVAAAAVAARPEIVDDDARALARERQRLDAAEPVRGARDDRDLAFEIAEHHVLLGPTGAR